MPIEIDLCPFAETSAVTLLGERGYTVNAFGNTYVRGGLNRMDALPIPQAIHVREMTAGESANFVQWSIAGFAAQDNPRPFELLEFLAISAIHRDDTKLFVAELEGEIAGTAALSVIDIDHVRGAHLHLASTFNKFRGQGIQAALLNARLQAAAGAGASLATVTARPKSSSARNAERAGFALAYTKSTFSRSG